MSLDETLAKERRARMAAERLLAQKQAELHEANRKLSRHARALSEEIVVKREEVEEVKDENLQVRADLERVSNEVAIAKRRLWESVETIQDGFAVFDTDGRMIAANSAYLAPFDGLECIGPGVSYDDMIQILLEEGIVDIGKLTPATWKDEMLTRWAQAEIPDKVVKLFNGTFLRLVDQRGALGDVVSLGLNITETIMREEELEDARNRAEAANRAKSAFLANMSHEIRTPMNGVVAMADLMADGDLDEEQRLYIDTIRNSGNALLAIINDVLDFSKIEAAKVVLHAEPFDLERTIVDIVTLLGPSIQEKKLQVSIDYDLFLPTQYQGDPIRIRQILTNLIGNAVKFTAEGQVLIRVVGLPVEPGPRQRVHVTVEDTGIGIPEEMRTHIFGEFNQVEDERNRKYEGTGLGLAITKQLVELMGGEIWVESEVGKGSCFGLHITLPVLEDGLDPVLPAGLKHAVVAMDDNLHRSILEKRLIALGLSVVLVSTREALAAEKDRADVLFIDQDLTDLDGGALPGELAKRGAHAPILLLAPFSGGRDRVCKDQVAGVLTKPLTRPDLTSALAGLHLHEAGQAAGHIPAPEPGPASREAAETDGPPKPTRAMRVLTVEDNKTNQLVFSKLVKALDIDLKFANDGREALAAWEEFQPDLVFMDISMPVMDGKEATRTIRSAEQARGLPPTRIVALTAHALTGDGEEIMSHGLDAYLTKPLRKPAILAEIESTCPNGVRPPLPTKVAAV
ncbi:ATP-binding protein [Aliiroseovarius sp.]|uniref:ATP-binding protein n=1 Tax=Aliiroseovarius sp. TaxID=1872442 RepID=UPI002616B024|nr:ATP-binding protein [Aliiroseovarius sp.]